MNYGKFSLSSVDAGSIVSIELRGVESDAFIVDSSNLGRFERGGRFEYYGGHYRSSPVMLRVPRSGNWTAIVIPGMGGRVDASVSVIPT